VRVISCDGETNALQHLYSSLEGVKCFVTLKFSLIQSYIRVDNKGLLLFIGMRRVGESNSLYFAGMKHVEECSFSFCSDLNTKELLFFMFAWTMGSKTFIMEYIKHTKLLFGIHMGMRWRCGWYVYCIGGV